MAALPLGELGPDETPPVFVDWERPNPLPGLLISAAIIIPAALLIARSRARSNRSAGW